MALASAEMAMKGIPPGTPDWLRAQDIAMVSKAELKKDKKDRKSAVTDTDARPPSGEILDRRSREAFSALH